MAKLVLAVLFLAIPSLGQQTATCNDTLKFKDWAYNSLNQSPCDIASALGAPCYGNVFSISPLPKGNFYTGVPKDQQSECLCNSVYFNALSACAACQGGDLSTWSKFKYNCSRIYPGLYPGPLPVPVPAYVYQDVTTSDKFDVAAAQVLEQSGVKESSASSASPPTSTPVPSPSISIAPAAISASASNSNKSTSVGAIIGAAIGGVAGALLIIVGIWLLLRYHRRQRLAEREEILGEAKAYYASNPNSPSFGAYSLPGSPAARSDADATFSSSVTPYTVRTPDYSMSKHGRSHGAGSPLGRRASPPEI